MQKRNIYFYLIQLKFKKKNMFCLSNLALWSWIHGRSYLIRFPIGRFILLQSFWLVDLYIDLSAVKMALRYYFDLMSQPSRAVYIFLKANNIQFEAKPVALRKGNHMQLFISKWQYIFENIFWYLQSCWSSYKFWPSWNWDTVFNIKSANVLPTEGWADAQPSLGLCWSTML